MLKTFGVINVGISVFYCKDDILLMLSWKYVIFHGFIGVKFFFLYFYLYMVYEDERNLIIFVFFMSILTTLKLCTKRHEISLDDYKRRNILAVNACIGIEKIAQHDY